MMHTTLKSCVVTLGNFCPVESLGGSIAATIMFAMVGKGIRAIIKAFMGRDTVSDVSSFRAGNNENESPLEKALRENAHRINSAKDFQEFQAAFQKRNMPKGGSGRSSPP